MRGSLREADGKRVWKKQEIKEIREVQEWNSLK
jgi:hypothetical protein